MARAARSSLLPDAPRPRGISADAEFFGGQHVQTVYINMPNLTSGTGSWILRFAERDGAGREDGEITSPVAVKKVDPKYTPSAIRDRVEGTVTLAAQILRDGTVASVEVVRGLDPRLDLSAVQALTLWVFEPARKKGVPIDLDVLVQIPFRLPAF
jgi:TonB family protein